MLYAYFYCAAGVLPSVLLSASDFVLFSGSLFTALIFFTMTLVLSSASLAARVVRQASASTNRVRLPAIAPPPRSAAVATSHSWPAATLSLPVPAAYHFWSAAATTIVARGTATGDGGTVDTARRPPGGVQTTSAAARWFSASAVGGGGGDDGGVGPGVPSATQINAALDEVNERFGEARLLLGEARDALGSVYFGKL